MFQKLKTYGTYQNTYCGVEHHGTLANKENIHFLVLKKKKSALAIDASGTLNSITELKKQLSHSNQQHLYLIINTEDVLTKKLDGVFEFEKAITKAYSNLKRTDFYMEVVTSNEHTFVSICRKDRIDSILKEYEQNNLNVIGFSLGNLMSSALSAFINSDEINTSNAKIQYKNNALVGINHDNEPPHKNYDINGLEVNSNQLLSLSGIIAYYTKNTPTQSNYKDLITNLKTNFTQKRVFDFGLKTGLSFIFLLLLLSFLVFSHFQSKANQLTNENQVSENLKNTLLKLKEKTAKKKKLFTEVTDATNSKVSLYLDEIGKALPTSVLLTALQYQPKTTAIKKNKEILTDKKSIVIKGKSSNSKGFSIWVESLEKIEWINSVAITNYGTGKKSITEFDIKLSIK